jgi:peroxiredoxin (alkyl hydroperoxide reductase subunit C)
MDSTEYSETDSVLIIEGSNVTFRATYLIDETGKIFHESVNDMPLGRNVNEYHYGRCLHTHPRKGEVCPATKLGSWQRSNEC